MLRTFWEREDIERWLKSVICKVYEQSLLRSFMLGAGTHIADIILYEEYMIMHCSDYFYIERIGIVLWQKVDV